MALFLNVPFIEKDEAKALGAKWDPTAKKWYVEDYHHYTDFKKWIIKNNRMEQYIICKAVYVVEVQHTCKKCKRQIPIIAFGFRNYISLYKEMFTYLDYTDKVHIVPFFKPMPDAILQFVKEKYSFDKHYTKRIKKEYYANCCKYCGSIQKEYDLFEDFDSPFWIKKTDHVVFYEFLLKDDILVDEIDDDNTFDEIYFDARNVIRKA